MTYLAFAGFIVILSKLFRTNHIAHATTLTKRLFSQKFPDKTEIYEIPAEQG